MLNMAAIAEARLEQQPFPHFLVTDSLLDDALNGVLQDFPAIDAGGSIPVQQTSAGPRFLELLNVLEGDAFRSLMERKFAIDLEGRPVVTTVRGMMRHKDGRVHTDSRSKLLTVLLYFNREWTAKGGRLRLLDSPDSLDRPVKEIAPLAGTMLGFLVTPDCWHGHTPIEGKRLSLQLNYLVSNSAESKHSLLHGLSARAKRLFTSR